MKMNLTWMKNHSVGILLVIAVVLLSVLPSIFEWKKNKDSIFNYKDAIEVIDGERMITTATYLSSRDDARIAGTEGESLAADWIKNEFEKIGLEVNVQTFPVEAYVCDSVSLEISSKDTQRLSDIRVLSFSAPTPAKGITAEIISVGKGAESDYSGIDPTGKIVLIQRGDEFFRVKQARAVEKGAIGALYFDPQGESAISITLGSMSEIPAICISRLKGLEILKRIESDHKVMATMVIDARSWTSESKNVIGYLKSPLANNRDYVVVGAHYDSVDTPGAIDNASGVAVLLEMARVCVNQKNQVKSDMRFIAFGAEEIGLIGSSFYAERMDEQEDYKPIAMINFDMVGAPGAFAISSAYGQMGNRAQNLAIKAASQFKLNYEATETDASDHVPFSVRGVPSVLIDNVEYTAYHTDFDNPSQLDSNTMVQACRIGIAIADALIQ